MAPGGRKAESAHDPLAQLHAELAGLRASRERLVLAADEDHREIERVLHEGVQQHLVTLALNLQLAAQAIHSDPPAAKQLLEAMGDEVREALAETARTAERIYPPLLEAGLAVALRAAFATAPVPVAVDVGPGDRYPPAIARTVYRCCLEAVAHAAAGSRATVDVRETAEGVAFEVVVDQDRAVDPGLGGLKDRVDALGGRLTITSQPGGEARVAGLLPLSR
jgi:signal transduction histidine kinase